MSLNSNTELALTNTTANSGSINLPPASASQGRVITFKDAVGKFGVNSLTLVCDGSDTFEDDSSFKVLTENNGIIQVVASGTKWYILTGTQQNFVTVSTLQALNISSVNISTANLLVSSLTFVSTNTISLNSTFAIFNSNIFAGTRVYPATNLDNFTFTPYQIPGLSLWLDGADSNTITLNGNNISRWRDKSLSGSDAVQTTAVNQPLYSTNGAFFRVSGANPSFFNINNLGLARNITSGHCFIVFNASTITGIGIANNVAILNAVNSGAGGRYTVVLANAGGSPAVGMFARAPDSQGLQAVFATTSYNVNSNTFISIDLQYANRACFFYRNGNSNSSNLGIGFITPATDNVNSGFVTINSGSLNTNLQNSYVYEILLVTNNVLTTIQRQQVEGYLAWKWGLQSNLPANHPYINAPP